MSPQSDEFAGGSLHEPLQPIAVGGNGLSSHRHICAFFHGEDEHYGVLLPLIKEGLVQGEKAVHILNPQRREEHLRRLQAVQIDTSTAEEAGQLEVLAWQQVHLSGGAFNQDRTLRLIDEIRHRSRQQGFCRIRFVTQMEWAMEDGTGVDGLLEYEASANRVPFDDMVVCAYDLTRFGAELVVDILRTHPSVIIGGTLQANPFYVPPEQFIQELRERRAAARRSGN